MAPRRVALTSGWKFLSGEVGVAAHDSAMRFRSAMRFQSAMRFHSTMRFSSPKQNHASRHTYIHRQLCFVAEQSPTIKRTHHHPPHPQKNSQYFFFENL
jgi:hypothetical protein